MTARPRRVVLDEAGFRRLVRGEVVALRTVAGEEVHLALADIGWAAMYDAVLMGRDRAEVERSKTAGVTV
jgi:hypothetical protein